MDNFTFFSQFVNCINVCVRVSMTFLARLFEEYKSYCTHPGVGVGVGVCVPDCANPNVQTLNNSTIPQEIIMKLHTHVKDDKS